MERAERTRKPPASDRTRTRHDPELVVQAKLEVGPAGDAYEREADDVAAQVVRTLSQSPPDPAGITEQDAPRVQRTTPPGAGIGADGHALGAGTVAPRIRRRAAGSVGASGGGLDADTEQRIQASRGGGRPMPASARTSMESAFGTDFSGVRVHTGAESTELSNRIQAKAFTVGSDIHFRDGLPDTSTSAGQHLLAHELTHTIQQSGGGVQRLARRASAGSAGERVQRTGVRVAGRVSAPVVQRVGEAKAAFDAMTKLVTDAQALRDKAQLAGTTLEELAQYKIDAQRMLDEADAHLVSAQKDKAAWAGYSGQLKTKRVQIDACKSKVSSPEVAATSSLSNINAVLAEFQGAVGRRADEAQLKASEAQKGMRDARASNTTTKAKQAAANARQASTELQQLCRAFDSDASATMAKVNLWVTAAAADHLAAGAADRSRQKLQQCIDLTASILGLLRTDADQSAAHANTMADAVIRVLAANKDKKAKEAAQKEMDAADAEAEKLFVAADDHARKCADEAAAAKKLADEAIAAADEADRLASGADAAASRAEGTAKSATGSMAFYAKHLAHAPSADASAMVEQRRGEAERAEQTARDKRAESDALALAAEEAHRTSTPLEEESAAKGRASSEAAEQRGKAEQQRTSAQQAKATADRELGEATQEHADALQSGTRAKDALEAHGRKLNDLSAAVPDVALRSQIRLAYGDADAQVLLSKGVEAQLLVDAAPTIKAMRSRWTVADAGDVVKRIQDLGGKTLLADFHTKAAQRVTARRALDLLDCPGDGIAWFVATAVASADKLLDHGWPAVDIKRLLRAAEKNANLGAQQLATFEALIEKIAMPVDTGEKLLKTGATATFLIDHALTSIEKLLAVPWDVDKIVSLVKAANDLCKPSKEQFEKFCKLVADNAVSEDNAVAMMKGADCTGAYLVDTAFLPVRDAVVDGWNTDQVKGFVHAAEHDAALTKVQIERFYKLVHDNTFTAANVKACLTSTGVASWTTVMDRIDDFVADGNTGAPAAVGGVAAASHTFGPPGNRVRIDIQVARVQHFVAGHTFKHYEFTHANIYRGGGNQPSSMWARGTTAADVAASALAAIQTPGVQALATNARAGTGGGEHGDFDQGAFAAYVAGVQAFPAQTVLMQFFPVGNAVPPDSMAAIGRLFRGAI